MSSFNEHTQNSPSFQQNVSLLKAIKRGQQPLWNDTHHGFLSPRTASLVLEDQKRGIENETSVARFLSHTDYNIFSIRGAFSSLLDELEALKDKDLDKMRNISANALFFLVDSGLNEGKGLLENYTVGMQKGQVLSSIISAALIQPSLIYLSKFSNQEYLDAWERTTCPICGNIPSIVVKNEAEVWRFKCTFCYTSYKMDIFSCPSCGEKDVSSFEFTLVGDNQEYEIASCRSCSQYYKIINMTALKNPIQEGMEGVCTEILDDIAHENGLNRLDELVDVQSP